MLRAAYSVLQMWFPGHSCFFFRVPMEYCCLGNTPSLGRGPFFPCRHFPAPALLNTDMASSLTSGTLLPPLPGWLRSASTWQDTCFPISTSHHLFLILYKTAQPTPKAGLSNYLANFGMYGLTPFLNTELKFLAACWMSNTLIFHFKPATSSWHYAISVSHVSV